MSFDLTEEQQAQMRVRIGEIIERQGNRSRGNRDGGGSDRAARDQPMSDDAMSQSKDEPGEYDQLAKRRIRFLRSHLSSHHPGSEPPPRRPFEFDEDGETKPGDDKPFR